MCPARMALPGTRLVPAWLLAFTDARKHPHTAYYAYDKVDMALREEVIQLQNLANLLTVFHAGNIQ